jgi:putative phage-type endonuclease
MITEQQLKDRVNYLGGSDCAAILGISRWKTPLRVFMSKVYPAHDNSENIIGGKGEAIYWGNQLEDKVAEGFELASKKKVHRVNETLVHPDHEFIRANIDRRVVGEDAILECKTASNYKADEWEGNEIPTEYILQVMHYLAVTGKKKAYIACLLGGQKFLWKEVHRDEDLIKTIIEKEVDFWNTYIVPKVPPMATADDSGLLNRLYPEAEKGSAIELPENYLGFVEERKNLIKNLDKIKDKIQGVQNRIEQAMGTNEQAKVGEFIITWKNSFMEKVDSKVLKEKHPKIYDECLKMIASRRFSVKKIKEKK